MPITVPTKRRLPIADCQLPIGVGGSPIGGQFRRGSVLVLVMTLLGILFVLGVAFLATMNFEADMIVSESQRNRADTRVSAVVEQLGSTLRDGLKSDSEAPFGNPSAAMSATVYAEMPGVQNKFSPIEPYRDAVGRVYYRWFTDLEASKRSPFRGPMNPDLEIDTTAPPGTRLIPGEPYFVLDADGDGISDSLQVDASVLDFSDAQLAALSARLNPPSNPNGKVYVGMRVIPHGGLVNLNAAHPKLIENVLGVSDIFSKGDPDYGYFQHRPTQNQTAYSPLMQETSLRRRSMFAPHQMLPSWLQGDPFSSKLNGGADMSWQLFPPLPIDLTRRRELCDLSPFQDSDRCFRYSPFAPNQLFNSADLDSPPAWAVRMEPFTSAMIDPNGYEYDRRHLVTTLSHDDLLARGGRASNPKAPGGKEDLLTKMTQANQTAWDPDQCPALLPFEYPDYPQTIANPLDAGGAPCCPTDLGCKLNARKGRLQLSLPYLDDQIAAANSLTDPRLRQEAIDRIFRLIHDAFFLLVRNAAHVTTLEGTPCDPSVVPNPDCVYANGTCGANGKCTVAALPPVPFTNCATNGCSIPGSVCRVDGVCVVQPRYWQDASCAEIPCDVAAGEVCDPILDRCIDPWTGQTHSQALISRTAAALTANFIDYADADDNPTRIALRSLDLEKGMCITGPNTGQACDMDWDCLTGGVCSPPRGMCVKGANTGRACGNDAACGPGGGANSCQPPSKVAGREFDFDPLLPFKPQYVYGLERQPYITEVVTNTDGAGEVASWAVELFNPHANDIDLGTSGYFLYQIPPSGPAPAPIPLNGSITSSRPFIAFVFDPTDSDLNAMIGDKDAGTVVPIPIGATLMFKKDWTLYLVRQHDYAGNLTEIVVDQFVMNGFNLGVDLPPGAGGVYPALFSIERFVRPPTPTNLTSVWTATIPVNATLPGVGESDATTLGDWNGFLPVNPPHPVEVNFANLGIFSRSNGAVSFPTTGSLLMLMRHANRAFPKAGEPMVKNLAFTTQLIGETKIKNPVSGVELATIATEQQIDNGRMPVFDTPTLGTDNNWYSAHHLAPSATQLGAPGNLDTLPWGQLVFDYFTALPLSNAGPYFVADKDRIALPDSLPRVDLDGLRVHGRINLNAAPWKVLAGLPFVPMQKIPVAFKDRIRTTLGLSVPDNHADVIGPGLAESIVAYRDLRPILGTGNYYDGSPAPGYTGPTPPPYARGWDADPSNPANPTSPLSRRGTGFMSVGELANVRHFGAASPFYRIDSGVIGVSSRIDCMVDTDCTGGEVCRNSQCVRLQNYVDAVAGLVALGDWVTVRSQVFTVYGVLRGEDDPTIIDPDPSNPPTLTELRARDADSRALRFQETIDRLPTLLGEPVPTRIGGRTLTRYTDVRND